MAGVAAPNEVLVTPRVFVIGLGSTGCDICDGVIERIEEMYDNGLQDTPWIQLFGIETESEDSSKPLARLGKYYRANVGAQQIQFAKIQPESLNASNDFTVWSKREVIENWQEGEGSGNQRMIGRATLLHPDHLPRITAIISEQVQGLLQLQPQFTLNGVQRRLTHNVTVFVCGSLVGGTGSGGLIDLGFILKNLGPLMGQIQVVGVLGVPGSSLGNNHLKANAYQALAELSHYYFPGTRYHQRVPLELYFTGGELKPGNGSRPFDSVFLVQPREGFQENQVQTMVNSVVEYIVASGTTESLAAVGAKLINPGTVYAGVLDKNGRPQNFSSFGVSVLEYPVERIARGCGARLASTALNEWLTRSDFDPTQAANEFYNRLGLTGSRLLEDLSKPESDKPSFDARLGTLLSQGIESSVSQGSARLAQLEQEIEAGFDPTRRTTGSVEAGEFRRMVESRAGTVEQERLEGVRRLLSEMITDVKRGPNWSTNSIKQWQALMDKEKQSLQTMVDPESIQMYREEMDVWRTRLDQAQHSTLIGLMGWRAIAVEKVLNQYESSARMYWTMRLQSVAAGIIAHIYTTIGALLMRAYSRIDDSQFGLVHWARQLRDGLEKTYHADRDEEPQVNGWCDFDPGPGKTLDQEYSQIIAKIDTPSVDGVPPGIKGEEYAKAVFFKLWKIPLPNGTDVNFLERSIVDDNLSPFDPVARGANPEGKVAHADEIRDTIHRARAHFLRELKTRNVSERLDRLPNKPAIIQNAVAAGNPFIGIDDTDTSGGAPAAATDIRTPRFAFINGGPGLGGTPEQAIRQQIGQTGWEFIENRTPHRIVMIECRAVFSAYAVRAMRALEQFAEQEVQRGWNAESRKDEEWRRMDGREPIPQFVYRKSAVLVAIALGVVRNAGGLFVEVPAILGRAAEKVMLDPSLDESAIKLHRLGYSAWLEQQVKLRIEQLGQHATTEMLQEFSVQFSKPQRMRLFWLGAEIDTGMRAVMRMKPFITPIPGLYDAWKAHFAGVPETLNYELVGAGNDSKSPGFYCLLCSSYLGRPQEAQTVEAMEFCSNSSCKAELRL